MGFNVVNVELDNIENLKYICQLYILYRHTYLFSLKSYVLIYDFRFSGTSFLNTYSIIKMPSSLSTCEYNFMNLSIIFINIFIRNYLMYKL
jgi:hypothetical protein